MNKIEKKEIEDLVDKRLAKALQERIKPLADDIDNLKESFRNLRDHGKDISRIKEELAVYEGEIKGIKLDLKARAKAFDEFTQDIIQKRGANEYQGIIDAIDGLAHSIQEQPSSLKRVSPPPQPKGNYDNLPWKQTRKKTGHWLWSDKSEGLAQRIHDAGGKITEGGYDYGLYGDIHEELGIKKCVSRYTARKKT